MIQNSQSKVISIEEERKTTNNKTYPFIWADTDGVLLSLDAGTFIAFVLLQAHDEFIILLPKSHR